VVFNSLEYAVFLPLVLAVYWQLPFRWQNRFMLVASYVFYGAWDVRFLTLLMISTGVDYVVGRRLGTETDERRRKRLLAVSLIVNLGILGFFKYFGFFVDSLAALLHSIGFDVDPVVLSIVLPVGISFYTFQSISYSFDVYRKRIEPTQSLVNFALYVAWFPQLVAGPIERARKLLPQIEMPRSRPTSDIVRSALFLILLGLFKKVAIADVVAPFVNETFATAATAGTIQLVLGAYAFGLQIYGDFSGYSDIARGSSRLFGIELMRNFEQPYLSRNITAFWRTWHISLSNWLHDYLYVPLGGNRGTSFETYRNLIVTMLLGGLWHGAAWTFVIWGGLHGIYLALHRRFGGYAPRGYQGRLTAKDVGPMLITLAAVTFAWIFFRANTLGDAIDYVRGLVSLRPGVPSLDQLAILAAAGLVVFLIDVAQRNSQKHSFVMDWPPVARGLAYGFLILGVLVFSGGDTVPFIYFQF